jgi:hypothetical protein
VQRAPKDHREVLALKGVRVQRVAPAHRALKVQREREPKALKGRLA